MCLLHARRLHPAGGDPTSESEQELEFGADPSTTRKCLSGRDDDGGVDADVEEDHHHSNVSDQDDDGNEDYDDDWNPPKFTVFGANKKGKGKQKTATSYRRQTSRWTRHLRKQPAVMGRTDNGRRNTVPSKSKKSMLALALLTLVGSPSRLNSSLGTKEVVLPGSRLPMLFVSAKSTPFWPLSLNSKVATLSTVSLRLASTKPQPEAQTLNSITPADVEQLNPKQNNPIASFLASITTSQVSDAIRVVRTAFNRYARFVSFDQTLWVFDRSELTFSYF